MRFIRCARYREEQNLFAFQYRGNIYYRAFRDIPIGRELLVWYDDIYHQYMGLPTGLHDMASIDPTGESRDLILRPIIDSSAETRHQSRTVVDATANEPVAHNRPRAKPQEKVIYKQIEHHFQNFTSEYFAVPKCEVLDLVISRQRSRSFMINNMDNYRTTFKLNVL